MPVKRDNSIRLNPDNEEEILYFEENDDNSDSDISGLGDDDSNEDGIDEIVINKFDAKKGLISTTIIDVNSSVPKDNNEYYCIITMNSGTDRIAVKLSNRVVAEVDVDKNYKILRDMHIDPRSFKFVRRCVNSDFNNLKSV